MLLTIFYIYFFLINRLHSSSKLSGPSLISKNWVWWKFIKIKRSTVKVTYLINNKRPARPYLDIVIELSCSLSHFRAY